MSKRVSAAEFFLKPPLWFDVIVWTVTSVSTGASVALLCLDIRSELWAVGVYAAALVFLVLSLYLLLTFRDIPERISKNKHVKRFVDDFGFRSYVMTVCAAVLNLLYAIFGTVVAVLNSSLWLGALVWYRIVIVAARAVSIILIGRNAKKPNIDEYKLKIHLYIGVMINILAIATIPVVLLVVWQQDYYDFFGIAVIYTIALAAYSFFKLAVSFKNFRRAQRSGDMAIAATRNIGVCDALISIFALQATVFAAFGGGGVADVLNPVTGSVVAAFIFAIGVSMIVRSATLLRSGSRPTNIQASTESGEDGVMQGEKEEKGGAPSEE